MRGHRLPGSSVRLMLAATLIVVPGVVLAWLGFAGIADREEAMRAANSTTATLIRDRLLAELASRVDSIERSAPPPADLATSPSAAASWLRTVSEAQPWLESPLIIAGPDRVLGVDVWSGGGGGQTRTLDDDVAAETRAAERAELLNADLGSALVHYRRAAALARDPITRAFLESRIGRTLTKQKRFDEAMDAYEGLLALPIDHTEPHGLPLALVAREQIADILAEAGRASDALTARVELLEWLLDHPWDLRAGHAYYVQRGLTLAPHAPEAARAQAAQVIDAGRVVNDVLAAVAAASDGERLSVAPATGSTQYAPLGDDPTRALALHDLGLSDGTPITLGFVVTADSVTSLLQTSVLSGVDLGADRQVQLVDGRANSRGSDEPLNLLASAGMTPALPGWRLAIVDTQGRTLAELSERERWTAGLLVAGALVALILGVVVTGRAWRREAQLAKLRTDFVSNVSHELKTPLALIRMFGETLESGMVADPERRREFYGIIRRESERLTHLIDNVLDTAKIEAGTKSFSFAETDLTSVVRDVIEAYTPLLTRLGFHLGAVIPQGQVMVSVDRDAVAQALVNLMQNAIKYSGESRDIKVALAAEGDEVRIDVVDQGIGIASGEMPHIFDAYYRASSGDSSAPAGSGLGLSIVQHVMRAHGGRVDVASDLGRGSTFSLVFPRRAPSAQPTAETAAPVQREAIS